MEQPLWKRNVGIGESAVEEIEVTRSGSGSESELKLVLVCEKSCSGLPSAFSSKLVFVGLIVALRR
jgi:hypothetical protein